MDTIANQQPRESKLVPWTSADASAYRREPLRAKHRLHELELFSDEALLDLLEHYPRERLQAFTMGTNPLDRSDWQPVDTTGASGKDLMAAVTSGRLWFHLLPATFLGRAFRG